MKLTEHEKSRILGISNGLHRNNTKLFNQTRRVNMNVEQRFQSLITYVSGFSSIAGAFIIKEMPVWTMFLQFGMALIGFFMVCWRFRLDYKRAKLNKEKMLPLDANSF